MAHDAGLANRIREMMAGERGVQERKMFGGIAFLIDGNLSVAASGRGGLLVRVDPEEMERLAQLPDATPMVMRGRPMKGWLRVAVDGAQSGKKLEPWVKRGVAYARSLPAKP